MNTQESRIESRIIFIFAYCASIFFIYFFMFIDSCAGLFNMGGKLNMWFFPIFSFRNSPYLAFFTLFSRFFLHPFVIIASIVTGFRVVSEQFQSSFRAVLEQF